MKNSELVSVLVSAVAVLVSIVAIRNERKSFILSIINDRVKVINNAWFEALNKGHNQMFPIKDYDFYIWSPVVSEIVITTNILNKLIGCNYLLLSRNNFDYIFWEQLNTDLRIQFSHYEKTDKSGNEFVTIFQKQMADINKQYIIKFSL